MSDEKLDAICTTLSRIELKLDASADKFAAHVVEDALLAHEVRMLSKQRGYFLSGCVAIGAGITAAATYAVRRIMGHH